MTSADAKSHATSDASEVSTPALQISLNTQSVILDGSGALFWPRQSLLVVADLHFEKGSHFAERGQFLPPYDTGETLRRLANVMDVYKPRKLIALGDSFHDRFADVRAHTSDRDKLSTLQTRTNWIWILGNHDPELPHWAGGTVAETVTFDDLTFCHEPEALPATGEICGHLHPVARIKGKKGTVRKRCFATNGSRLVMPAFGALTGGLNVCDKAFDPVFGKDGFHAYMIGRSKIFPVHRAKLVHDRRML